MNKNNEKFATTFGQIECIDNSGEKFYLDATFYDTFSEYSKNKNFPTKRILTSVSSNGERPYYTIILNDEDFREIPINGIATDAFYDLKGKFNLDLSFYFKNKQILSEPITIGDYSLSNDNLAEVQFGSFNQIHLFPKVFRRKSDNAITNVNIAHNGPIQTYELLALKSHPDLDRLYRKSLENMAKIPLKKQQAQHSLEIMNGTNLLARLTYLLKKVEHSDEDTTFSPADLKEIKTLIEEKIKTI